jgi:hypothetical protein
LFGGSGFGIGDLNDLWRYDRITDMWTWVSGSSAGSLDGVYGTKGVSDPANYPGARTGSHAFKSVDGNLWLYGGYDVTAPVGIFSDLWRYVPDTTCAGCVLTPAAIFSAPNHICPGTCVDFLNNSMNASTYFWSFPGANPPTSTDENPTNICYYTPGTYPISLVASNSNSIDTLTLNNYLTVYPFPSPQGILQNGDTLIANQGALSYQWFYNGVIIPGATDYYYVAPESGNFNVIATDVNGCEVEAAIFNVIAFVQNIFSGEEKWVMPNPFTREIRIMIAGRLTLFDNIGQKIFEKEITDTDESIDLSAFTKGIYFIRLETGEKILQQKLVKM